MRLFFIMTDTSIQTQLLAASRKLFLKFGYSKVTMDEVAREMGMSKKTVYLYFPSKLKLMEEVISEMQNEITTGVRKIMAEQNISTLERLKQSMIFTGEKLSIISPFVASDLARNVPNLWALLKKMRYELAYKNIHHLVEEGIKSGNLKKEVSPELLLMFYSCAVQYLRDSSFVNDFPKDIQQKIPSTSDKIFEGIVEMLFKGIENE